MAKAATPKIDTAQVKALLNKSKDQPVNCAIGFAGDGSAVIMLNKTKQPRAVLKMMEDEYGDLKNPRWGTATVDTDTDAKLVILQLNKPVSGGAGKLKKALKGTGFSKIRIQLEDGSLAESAEEEDEDEAPAAAAAPAAPAFDTAGHTHKLTGLVKRMAPHMAGDAGLAKNLKTLAAEAQAKLKASDPAVAHVLTQLETALDGAGTGPHAGASKLAKSKLAWGATLKKIQDDVAKAKTGIADAIGHTELASALEKTFSTKVEPSLAVLDASLSHTLEELDKATDGAAREKAAAEARKIIKSFQQHAATDKVIAQLDGNPFVPVSIAKTLHATLSALSGAIR